MRKTYFLMVMALIATTALSAQSSFIKIKVLDQNKLSFPGAIVMIDPGNFAGTTNANGELTLTGLAPGEYRLTVRYLGYQTLDKTIQVGTGGVEIVESLDYSTSAIGEVVVLGDRQRGQAKALNQQKSNAYVSNIISADQMGRFPDANIGDAIKRVPGITMQNDQGEARNIIIRGMGPELNSVSLNGERIPSAEGDNRRIQMDLIPADAIQSVDVRKTLTPEMDGDAIGGSVNLITRYTPQDLRLSASLSGGYNSIREGFIGNAHLLIGNRLAEGKLGILINGSIQSNDYGSDNVEAVWERDEQGNLYIADHDVRKYDVKRVRRSAGISCDYKLNPAHVLTLNGSYYWRDDLENRFRLRHRLRGDESNLIYDSNGNITGFTNGEVIRQTKGGIDNDRNESRRLEDQRVKTASIQGDHLFGKLKLDWSAQYARASEVRPNERYIAMGRRSIEVSQDVSDPEFPLLSDATQLTDYTRLSELTEEFQDQFEEDINAKINVEWPLIIRERRGTLKAGLRLRSKTKERNNRFYAFEPVNSTESQFENITLLGLKDQTVDDFYPGSKYVIGNFIDPQFLGQLQLEVDSAFEKSDEPSEYLAGNYEANEDIYAGYAQWTQELSDKLLIVAGVRLEQTSLDYTGNIVLNEEDLQGKASNSNEYTDVLPGLNIRYNPVSDLVLRAAVTRGIARPKYYDLVPYFNVLAEDMELQGGNPKLEPIRSTNADLMAEYYLKSIGILSGGVFYKALSNFFYTYRDENYTAEKFAADFPGIANPIQAGEDWQFTQRRNGSDVQVLGFELGFQRKLDFLPGVLKDLGVYTNYTYTNAVAEGIYDNSGVLIREDVDLPGTAPHMFNLSLSYETRKLVANISGNYTAAYVDDSDDAGYSEEAFYDRYYDKQFFLDVHASYALLSNVRIFGEANNLTNQPLRYYQGDQSRTAQIEYYGPKFNVGVKWDLTR
ncbi:MAG: TonB-dependent receptor [Saprospiraceae bacterium]|nr:TonB-dependent receptor [Saprospiraceae bacterium]